MVIAPPALEAAAPSRPRWYAHGWNQAGVYRTTRMMAQALPRRLRLRAAARLGAACAPRFSRELAAVRANLARVAPDLDTEQREALARDVFRHFAMCFTDLITVNRRAVPLDRLLARIEGAEHLHAATAAERGVVVVTAHLGNWELAGRLLPAALGRPTSVVVAAEADPAVERFLRGGSAPVRFVVMRRPADVLPLVAALRRGEYVALQGDRALGSRGDVMVPFFGAPAAFPVGPCVLARATGAPLLPVFCVLGPDRRYTITIGPPIAAAPGHERAALTRWVAALERIVAAHPAQWFNFFDVWEAPDAGRTPDVR